MRHTLELRSYFFVSFPFCSSLAVGYYIASQIWEGAATHRIKWSGGGKERIKWSSLLRRCCSKTPTYQLAGIPDGRIKVMEFLLIFAFSPTTSSHLFSRSLPDSSPPLCFPFFLFLWDNVIFLSPRHYYTVLIEKTQGAAREAELGSRIASIASCCLLGVHGELSMGPGEWEEKKSRSYKGKLMYVTP